MEVERAQLVCVIRACNITQDINTVRVSLVDGDPTIRRARQIMLRSEGYEVRSYSTSAALLSDPASRDYPCIVLDTGINGIEGLGLISEMRATDWHGTAILLDVSDPDGALASEAASHGDIVFNHAIGDRTLAAAIAATSSQENRGETLS